MEKNQIFSKTIIEKIRSAQEAKIIQPVRIGQTEKRNELVFFIKPELLAVENDEKILNSLDLIREKFAAFHVEVNGSAIVPGNILDAFEIMSSHYGYINQLSRKASEMINGDTRQQMFEKLDLEKNPSDYKILGGHEFLEVYDADIHTLSDIWFGRGASKLRSGFYFVEGHYQGDPIILVNGFHPSQLLHFTREDHRIFLMLLHTDSDWYDLKFDLVGDTFPEKANPDSIRGKLFADPQAYGQEQVSINTNGVHLSAGPFEAAFEVVNFFGKLLSLDPEKSPPLAIKRAIESGMAREQALSLLENPRLNESDLFSETENLNTHSAIKLALKKLGT